jgi:hypothetical protein
MFLFNEIKSYDGIESQLKFIYDKKWDIMVILDACRYDVFREIITDFMDGYLTPVYSPGSYTLEWLRAVWEGKSWRDTIYFSATPKIWGNKLYNIKFNPEEIFLKVIDIWKDGWDDSIGTVPPHKVSMSVLALNSRLKIRGKQIGKDYKAIIHYMQPHFPYKPIIKTIRKIADIYNIAYRDLSVRKLVGFNDFLLMFLYECLENDHELRRNLQNLYIENLRWVLRSVSNLVNKLDGEIIITSDHGELLGEYGLYYHPVIHLPHLRIVPWFRVR